MGKIPWRRVGQSTVVFLPGESHGQRSLVGYSPWGCRVRHDWGTEHIYMQDAYTQRWIKYCSCLKEMEIVHEERGMEEIAKNLPLIQRKKCYTNCLHSEGILNSMVTEVTILCCVFKSCKEDQMVGWHRWFNGLELGQTLGGGEGQGGLACCSPWGGKQSDTARRLNKRLDLKSS